MTPDSLPRDPAPDATLALLRQGYRFIPDRCARFGGDAFRTRLLGREVLCFSGPRGVRLLYGAGGLTRQGAMPPTVLRLLQDKGSVQQLEGAAHRHRKALFVGLLVEEEAGETLATDFRRAWAERLRQQGETRVLDSASDTLAEVACRWVGFGPQISADADLRRALYVMSARTGSVGPRVLMALLRRRRVERRLARALDTLAPGSPGHRIARFAEDGRPLPPEVAVVEILNLLRPIVAVGRYIAFAARILVEQPRWIPWLRAAEDPELEAFCEELRRTSPFFPMTAALTTRPVRHEGLELPEGQWLLADLWGPMQAASAFARPEDFDPARGQSWRGQDSAFAPQGAGDLASTHRCPGEKVTLALMAAGLKVLCRDLDWHAPPQDLSVALNRVPARPESGVILSGITPRV